MKAAGARCKGAYPSTIQNGRECLSEGIEGSKTSHV